MLDITPFPRSYPPPIIGALPPHPRSVPIAMVEPAMPCSVPSELDSVPSEPVLLARIEALCLRFALPIAEDVAHAALAEEATMLQRHGLAELVYLGCAAVCLARIELPGRGLVLGVWAGSALLAQVGAVPPGVSGIAAPGELSAAFLATVVSGEMPVLRVLVAGAPDDRFLARLGALPALVPFSVQGLARGGVRLVLDAPPGVTSAVIELIPSPLLGMLDAAIAWTERYADARIDPADLPPWDEEMAALLGGEWASLLPVSLPSLPHATPIDRFEVLITRLSELTEANMPLDARAGLGVHLALVWALAGITASYPAAGWVALLDSLPLAALASGMAAAERAGVSMLPASVAWSEEGWGVEMVAGRWALRRGLASIPALGPLAAAICRDRAAQPYGSLFDLLCRVQALAEAPHLVLRLVLEGGLDDLHDRRALLAHWLEIDAWRARSLAPGDGSGSDQRSLQEVPDLAGPGSLPERQVAAWAQAFAPIAGIGRQEAIEDALLPAIAQAASPGDRVRVAGAVSSIRVLQPAGDAVPVALLELTDGLATIQALIAVGDGDDPYPVEGAWLVIDGLVAERAGLRLLVQDSLAISRAPRAIAVSVPVQGDRQADLARLLAVRAILIGHPGSHPAQVALLEGGRRRVLQLGELRVRWDEPLRRELEGLLGTGMAGPVDAE